MANSLEVRVPFLDYRLVRLSQRFGRALKQNGTDFKILLKRALGKRCPPEILARPKWGFDTPLRHWVSRPEVIPIVQALSEGLLVREHLVKASGVRDLVRTPAAISANARRIWNLLILEVWLNVRRCVSPPSASLRDLFLVHT